MTTSANEGKRRGIMKKLVLISAMAVFLSSMAAQAQSTNNWEFNTLGDTEGWHPVADSYNSLANGIFVTNGIDSVVLTSGGITGIDPGVQTTNTLSVATNEFWKTVEFRARTVSGGFSDTFAVEGMIAVANGNVYGDSSSWGRTDESDGWVVMTIDVSILSDSDLNYLRLDPPVLDDTQNFEFDYIKIFSTTNTPPPPVYKKNWEFNTPGDTEGWKAGSANDIAQIATASFGSESVLFFDTIDDNDAQVFNSIEPAILESGLYWSAVEIRMRHTLAGVGQVWDTDGTLFILGSLFTYADVTIPGSGVGGTVDWDTTTEADGWIVTRADITSLGNANIANMRIDPYYASGGKDLEIDYFRLETRSIPVLPPAPVKEIHSWEFNTNGDTEGWADNGTGDIVGMTVQSTISGSEVVLTSTDVQGAGDSQIVWNGPAITPPGAWAAWEVRMRQLDGNPGDLGTAPVDPFDINQVTFVANYWTVINFGTDVISFTPETNGWITAVFDISSLGSVDLAALRIDAVSDTDLNFEIDYTKVHSRGNKYDAWSQSVHGLVDADALTTADPDGDTFNNLYEFAYNGVPTDSNNVGFVESSIVDDGGTRYVEYNYERRTDANTGLTYTFEQKGDLSDPSWADLGDTKEVGTLFVDADHEMVTNRIEIVNEIEFHRATVTHDE